MNVVTSYHGAAGERSSLYSPAARRDPAMVSDSAGRVWMFGGTHHISSTDKHFGDVWSFDVASSMWAWEEGPPQGATAQAPPVYPSALGMSTPTSTPES